MEPLRHSMRLNYRILSYTIRSIHISNLNTNVSSNQKYGLLLYIGIYSKLLLSYTLILNRLSDICGFRATSVSISKYATLTVGLTCVSCKFVSKESCLFASIFCTNLCMQKWKTPHSPIRTSIGPASPPYSWGRSLFGTSLYKDSKSAWRCVCKQHVQIYVLLSCSVSTLFACCCLGSCLSNFKSRPLRRCIISALLWYYFWIFSYFPQIKYYLKSCVILQFRFWVPYIIYPFALFLDTIFMVPCDYQTLVDSKMQQYVLHISIYPSLSARRHLIFPAY